MSIGDGTSEGVLGSDGAVVGTLGAGRDATLGPAEGSALIEVKEGEFLFEAKPDFFIFLAFEGLGGCEQEMVVVTAMIVSIQLNTRCAPTQNRCNLRQK